MIKRIIAFCIIFLMCLSSIGFTANAQTATSWTEDFSNGLSNWTAYGYSTVPSSLEGSNYTDQVNPGYKVQNGLLLSGYNFDKDNTGLGNVSFIFHTSFLKGGNFSFDTFIADWTTTRQIFSVLPMISEVPNNNTYNFLGETSGYVYTDSIGLEFEGAFGYNWITLWNGYSKVGTYNVPGSLYNSFHHFVININLTNGINVFMDNKNIISTLSTPEFQSQNFAFSNRDGFSMFDNISVEGTPATTTTTTSQTAPSYEFIVVVPSIVILTLILDKKKKKDI